MMLSRQIRKWDDLRQPIEGLKFVGLRYAARLRRLGITTLRQLLWHLPARHEDYSERVPIGSLHPGDQATVQGYVERISSRRIFPRKLIVTTALVKDETGAIHASWFNQPYIEQTLHIGAAVSLAGKIKLTKTGLTFGSPQFEIISTSNPSRHTHGLIPIYPETEGVSSKYLRTLIQPLITSLNLPDPLPEATLRRNNLTSITDALKNIHFPQTLEDQQRARHRLAFDELLLFQMRALIARRTLNHERALSIPFDQKYLQAWVKNLPFALTVDQRIAAWEALKDLSRPYPMNRLLEGDVGSGKTMVALIAALSVARAGCQVVLLVPTEVLAAQHYATLLQLIPDVSCALLTSSRSERGVCSVSKNEVKKCIALGDVHIIVGTHAVIQKDVSFSKLALVVVDEQHRFGIAQRAALLRTKSTIPHLLSMTATPIPRTLALTIFGDLDISLIKEKPKGRKSIITHVISTHERSQWYAFVRSQVQAGRQAFVICPRVEIAQMGKKTSLRQALMSDLWAEAKAVKDEYERLAKEIFPDLKIAMLHGRMKPKQKEQVMREFRDGWHDILVATSVIEVGVDIPNATIMMVENAERFGLAQLHQFRGRIGRSEHASYCILFATSDTARLRALEKSSDGFELAEKDLALRGPGEFFGVKQSGIPDLAMAALADMELIKKARLEARTLLKDDPTLERSPLLKERLMELKQLTHFE